MGSIETLIALYGPAIVFVGTFLEGETIVVVAGFLAHQGIVNPLAVGVGAFLGSFLGDQFWFYLGRRHAAHPWIARIRHRPMFRRAVSTLEGHPIKFILTFRFIYGIRTISPVAIGLTKVPAGKFLVLNAVAAAIWAAAFTALGYAFGQTVEKLFGEISAIEHKILAGLGIALVVWAAFNAALFIRRRIVNRRSDSRDPPTP